MTDIEKITNHLINLLKAGNHNAADRAYEYALALQTERRHQNASIGNSSEGNARLSYEKI